MEGHWRSPATLARDRWVLTATWRLSLEWIGRSGGEVRRREAGWVKDGNGKPDGANPTIVLSRVGPLGTNDRDRDVQDRPHPDPEKLGWDRRDRHRRPVRAHQTSARLGSPRRSGCVGFRWLTTSAESREGDPRSARQWDCRPFMRIASGDCRVGEDDEPAQERDERPRAVPEPSSPIRGFHRAPGPGVPTNHTRRRSRKDLVPLSGFGTT